MVPSSDPFLQKLTSEKKKLKPDSNITYVFLSLEICLNIFANQRKEESLATPFFCEAYVPFGAPFGAQLSKFLSS